MTAAIEQYTEYYGDVELAKWRELGAKDKAANVIRLWSIVSPDTFPTIADIGCGDGAVIHELDRRGWGQSYVGFEVSPSGVAYAQQRQYTRPACFKLFDGTYLPVANKGFDLAILSHVLEHVEAPRLLLREAARIARYVFVEVPLELTARTPYDFHRTEVGHINLYNPLLIRHLVQSADLRVLAELVNCPSRAVFTYNRSVLLGTLRWVVKHGLLKALPRIACSFFTYHGCVLATSG